MRCTVTIFLFFCLMTCFGCVEDQARIWQQGAALLNSSPGKDRPLTTGEIGRGLKEALQVGTTNVTARLGREGGFLLDPTVHIPLPRELAGVQSTLDGIGMSAPLDDLERKLNRAAERAAPRAKDLFIQAIRDMTFQDVMAIYRGPDDAATRYFQNRMSPALEQEMSPVVARSLSEVGAIRAYEQAIGRYRELPFVPDVRADLTSYVVSRGMDGLFHYLAQEEKAIRNDPLKRTTELLRRVFGPS